MKRASILSLIVGGSVAAACGLTPLGCSTGASTDLFASSNGPNEQGSSSSGSGSSSASSSGAGGGSASSSSSGAGGDPSSSSSSSSSSSASSSSSSSASSSSSSSSGNTVSLLCGGATCSVPPDTGCCVHNLQQTSECTQGPPDQSNCITSPQAGVYDTFIQCQTGADCGPGMLCCANREFVQNGSYYSTLSCQAQCDYPDIVMCDALGEQGPDCPVVNTMQGTVQTTCKQSQLLPQGYLVCGT